MFMSSYILVYSTYHPTASVKPAAIIHYSSQHLLSPVDWGSHGNLCPLCPFPMPRLCAFFGRFGVIVSPPAKKMMRHDLGSQRREKQDGCSLFSPLPPVVWGDIM
jgi:hypothetical protein